MVLPLSILASVALVALAAPSPRAAGRAIVQSRPATARVIVRDLTKHLDAMLANQSVGSLLVLAPSDTTGPGAGIQWQQLKAPSRVDFVSSHDELHAALARHFARQGTQAQRHSRGASPGLAGLSHRRGGTSAAPTQATASGALVAPTASTSSPDVALMLLTQDGRLTLGQAALAAAASRRLRGWHTATLAYSRHSDKADSLLLLDPQGMPLAASFAETTLFRDAFNEVYRNRAWGPDGGGSGLGAHSPLTFTALQTVVPCSANGQYACTDIHLQPSICILLYYIQLDTSSDSGGV